MTWEDCKGELEESCPHSLRLYALWFHDKLKQGRPMAFVSWFSDRNWATSSKLQRDHYHFISYPKIFEWVCKIYGLNR